jgi:hypothetical protein
MRAAFVSQADAPPTDEVYVTAAAMQVGRLTQVAVVVDDTENSLALYVDGESANSAAFMAQLSEINDINNWLGRSQYSSDTQAHFAGTLLEFRIFSAALTTAQLQILFAAGPDASFLD